MSKDEHQTAKFRVDFQEWCIDIDKLLKVIEVLNSCSLFFCIVHYTHLFTCANQFTFVKLICTYSYIFLYCCSDCCIKCYAWL